MEANVERMMKQLIPQNIKDLENNELEYMNRLKILMKVLATRNTEIAEMGNKFKFYDEVLKIALNHKLGIKVRVYSIVFLLSITKTVPLSIEREILIAVGEHISDPSNTDSDHHVILKTKFIQLLDLLNNQKGTLYEDIFIPSINKLITNLIENSDSISNSQSSIDILSIIVSSSPKFRQDFLDILLERIFNELALVSINKEKLNLSVQGLLVNLSKCTNNKESFEPKCNKIIMDLFTTNTQTPKFLAALNLLIHSLYAISIKIVKSPEILQFLIDTAYDTQNSINSTLATEILAISCSDSVIRISILKSKNESLFFSKIESAKKSTNFLKTAAYAILAISKFVVGSQFVKEKIFPYEGEDNYKKLSIVISTIYQLLNFNETDDETITNIVIESLTILATFYKMKQIICYYNQGEFLKSLNKLYTKYSTIPKDINYDLNKAKNYRNKNVISPHGILQIIHSLTMSTAEYTQLFANSQEIQALQNFAQKGLYNANKVPMEIIGTEAGDESQNLPIRLKLVKNGFFPILAKHFKSKFSEMKQLKFSQEKSKNGEQSKNDQKSLNQQRLDNFCKTFAAILFNLIMAGETRLLLVQQGAIPLLLDLLDLCCDDKVSSLCVAALSRLFIPTNPLLLDRSYVERAARSLSWFVKTTEKELYAFEGMLALTNIASMDEAMRGRMILQAKVWSTVKEHLFSENFRLQRAALEVMCNLVQCREGIALLEMESGSVKIFVAFAKNGGEDEKSEFAAMTILAVSSAASEKVCSEIRRLAEKEDFIKKLKRDGKKEMKERVEMVLKNVYNE